MDSDSVLWICLALAFCTAVGCCTWNGVECAKMGRGATVGGCLEKKP